MVLNVKRNILSVSQLRHMSVQLLFGSNDLEDHLIINKDRVRMQRYNDLYFIKARVVNGDAQTDVQSAVKMNLEELTD
eukprot:15437469-Alexandrium_andersonii.AAC.1